MPESRTWTKVRSDLAHEYRGQSRPEIIADLRRELKYSRTAAALQAVVDDAPPLTAGQIDALRAILSPALMLDATGLPAAGSDGGDGPLFSARPASEACE